VATLASSGNVEERMQASVDVGEKSTKNVDKIEVELQKLIDMIKEQKIVAHTTMLEQNNV
jgi:hypothetical protein